MGRQIVKQPNGKYAIWSSVVDDFVVVDCNGAEDIIEEIVSDTRREITADVERVLEKLEAGEKPYYQFTMTFNECMDVIREIHGGDHAAEVMKEFEGGC